MLSPYGSDLAPSGSVASSLGCITSTKPGSSRGDFSYDEGDKRTSPGGMKNHLLKVLTFSSHLRNASSAVKSETFGFDTRLTLAGLD